ncbi:unnamed protein product [Polarella glacialis]|uniref:Homing endonuclease LAGLIDADG domain-containing protein n=1 Tax=Polarella glacialis TaxID=89957 RepID=A0A813G445_POLGL|nr:unnamed protein product [Polarella glacialis]
MHISRNIVPAWRVPRSFHDLRLCSSPALAQDSCLQLGLQQLTRRIERLKGLQRQIRWAEISCFSAFGELHALPIRAGERGHRASDDAKPTQEELEYLAGFFAGDGCVSAEISGSGCRLLIGQSCSHGEALMMFLRVFGGGIYRQSRGLGAGQPAIQWIASGSSARHAAALLGNIASSKQAQLHIAAVWPHCRLSRQALVSELKQLKHQPPDGFRCSSLAFVAGFFDAEGCILLPGGSRIKLEIGQRFLPILEAIQQFLQQSLPGDQTVSTIYPQGTRDLYKLSISHTATSKDVLALLLAGGLSVKRSAAQLALTIDGSNYEEVREKLAQLSGNQGRYQRLDADGRRRASKISAAKTQLRRYHAVGKIAQASELNRLLSELEEGHARLNATHVYMLYRRDIRSLLKQGAAILHR